MSPGLNAVAALDVLGRRDDGQHAHGKAELGDRRGRLDHRSAAAHVALQVLHAERRLERDAARVERDRLADEAEHHVGARVRRVVAHADQLRVARAARADCRERAHVVSLDPVAPVCLDRQVVAGARVRMLRQRLGCQVVRRSVRQVARRVEVTRDHRLPVRDLMQIGGSVNDERQLRPFGVAAA